MITGTLKHGHDFTCSCSSLANLLPLYSSWLKYVECLPLTGTNDLKHAMEATYRRIYYTSLDVTVVTKCRCDRRGTPASHLATIFRSQDGHYVMQCLLPRRTVWYDCPVKIVALLSDQGKLRFSMQWFSPHSYSIELRSWLIASSYRFVTVRSLFFTWCMWDMSPCLHKTPVLTHSLPFPWLRMWLCVR